VHINLTSRRSFVHGVNNVKHMTLLYRAADDEKLFLDCSTLMMEALSFSKERELFISRQILHPRRLKSSPSSLWGTQILHHKNMASSE